MINHKNKKIAIIDDEFYFRQSLIKILREESQRLGIEFVGDANNGDTGYELVRAQKPDIVLVDINMPGLDGLQLLEKLRSQNVHCEMIIISGYANFEYAKRAIPLGVNNYLLKPVNREELCRCLEETVEKMKQEEAAQASLHRITPVDITADNEYSAITNQVLKYVAANLKKPDLSVSLISTALHTSYSYICTSFKADTQKTINEYITESRMEYARKSFAAGCKNVALISHEMGYEDSSYFGKCFKKAFGISPSAYIAVIESKPIETAT